MKTKSLLPSGDKKEEKEEYEAPESGETNISYDKNLVSALYACLSHLTIQAKWFHFTTKGLGEHGALDYLKEGVDSKIDGIIETLMGIYPGDTDYGGYPLKELVGYSSVEMEKWVDEKISELNPYYEEIAERGWCSVTNQLDELYAILYNTIYKLRIKK